MICPICKQYYIAVPAISRKDNKTEICPYCGLQEALYDFAKQRIKELKKEELNGNYIKD